MNKPIFAAIFGGLAAAVLLLAYPLPAERIEAEGDITAIGQELVDEWQHSARLDAASLRTLDGIKQREAIIVEFREERVSLDEVRREFRRLNDLNPACWLSLRAAFRGCSDEQCLDRQIQTYLQARRLTPEERAAPERLRFEPAPRVEGE